MQVASITGSKTGLVYFVPKETKKEAVCLATTSKNNIWGGNKGRDRGELLGGLCFFPALTMPGGGIA
jgi:hypothetical protein